MIGALLGFVTGGSWRLYLYGSLALVALGYVGWTQIALANRNATIAELEGREARRVATANLAALDAHRKRADRVNVALMQERDAARMSASISASALRALTSARDRQEPISEALDGVLDALTPKVPQ